VTVPFALNDTHNNLRLTRHAAVSGMQYFLDEDLSDTFLQDISSARGCSDKSWNLICLSSYLHTLWGKGYWAFQLHSSEPAQGSETETIVTLMFHWMRQAKKVGSFEGDAPFDWDKGMSFVDLKQGNLKVHYMDSGRSVQTGDLFHVKLLHEDAERFKRMIEVQWAAIKLLEMAGGAGHPEILPDSWFGAEPVSVADLRRAAGRDTEWEEDFQDVVRASPSPASMPTQQSLTTLPFHSRPQSTTSGLGEVPSNLYTRRLSVDTQSRDAKGKGKEEGSPKKTPTTPTQPGQPTGLENQPTGGSRWGE
jgi:hypothetical protein